MTARFVIAAPLRLIRELSGPALFSLATGAFACATAVLVLLGWQLDIPTFKSVIVDAAVMKPNTAICLFLLGVALIANVTAIGTRRAQLSRRVLIFACTSVALSIAGITLAEHLGANPVGIDVWLFREELLATDPYFPGRISLATSLDIVLLSIAVMLLHARARPGKRLGQVLTIGAILIPFFALLGYLYDARALYEFKPFASVALHTAVALIALGCGALAARPERSVMSELLSPHHGGLMARRVLPFALLVPIVVGWLRLIGEQKSFYGTEVGVALFAASNALIISVLVWWTARHLNRLDAEQRTSEYFAVHAIRAAEARWRTLIEASAQIVWTVDADGASFEDSPSWQAFTGQSLQQTRENGFQVLHPQDRARVLGEWQRAVATRTPLESEYRLRHVSGEWRWTSVRAVPLRSADGAVTSWVGMHTDITDRKRAHALTEGQNHVLEMIARDAPLTETLDAITRLIDAQGDELVSSILLLDPDGKRLRHGAAPRLPEVYTSAIDGAVIGPNVGSCGTAAYRRKAVYVEDIATDPLWTDYKQLALPHGLRACWSTPILDAEGQVLGTFAVYCRRPKLPNDEHMQLIELATQTAAICLTRHRAVQDRKRLQESQLRSQKLEALGTLAGGIAHDFNNMLLVIAGNARLTSATLPMQHEGHAPLSEIVQASARATDLVRRILSFSRPQTTKHRHIELQPVIAEALQLMRSTLPAMIEIRSDLPPDLPLIGMDLTQVHQIVVNLATNAAHAMERDGGVLEVRLESVEVTPQMAAIGPDLRAGRYVRLTVRDEGTGMSQDTMARIFDPFFTTKPLGQGTGLGLSIVHGIMQSCGGAVRVQSTLGKGTTFHLYFPALDSEIEAPASATPTVAAGAAGQHILLIDDEPSLVRLSTLLLNRRGYKVTGCTDPVSAVQQFRLAPHSFEAVITDLSMPGMTGFDCAQELLEIRPDIPIVLTSGYVRPEDEVKAKAVGIRAVVTKPGALDQLPEILATVFAATG